MSKPSSRYIEGLRAVMREAVAEYRKYDAQWNNFDRMFKAKIKEENRIRRETGREPHSHLSIAQQRNDTLVLKDAMEAAKWFRDKANTLAATISAEYAAQSMLEEL